MNAILAILIALLMSGCALVSGPPPNPCARVIIKIEGVASGVTVEQVKEE